MLEKILAKKKYIIAALVIIAVLVIAFFASGNTKKDEPKEPVTAETTVTETVTETETDIQVPEQTEVKTEEPAQKKTETVNGMEINPETGKDKYNTTPVPAGKPAPVEPEESTDTGGSGTCTVSISCATILNNMSALDPAKTDLVPADGWILKAVNVSFSEGESVFDVLQRVTHNNGIHMESVFTPMYNSAYIEGINNLYEFDCGELSGWMYSVNGWYPNYGCSRYQVKNGDVIKWVYTCDLGADVGGSNFQ